ncbi:MAG: RHS repeat-associated core domain-containing protein, partial [Christensenellaceae bacterium]
KKGEILSISENIKYKYDTMGNICRIDENGEPVVWYKYDALNRLIREDNKTFGKTWLYSYDNKGNILSKRTTNFTLKENAEECEFESVQYEYDGDKLLSYGTEACEYDAIGNPTKYCGKVVAWENGRQMVSYDGTAFTYDGLGRRLSKGNISYTYDSNNRVIKQSNGLEFFYDNTGVAGIEYNNATYLYQKDAQGNICKILDSNGGVIVQYKYDAWGNHAVLDANGADISDAAHIGKLNPYRYRGYYYDTETGLYYLKSRYYDPEVCRFITIDDIQILSISKEVINGLNLYCYCNNNPVNDKDESGYLFGFLLALLVGGIVGALVSVAGTFIGDIANNIWNYGFNFAAWEFSNWQTYLGAAIGGFVGGALGVAFPGSYVLVAGITGAASTLATNLLEIVSGVANYSVGEILANIVIDGLVSAAFGKLTQGFVVKGINAGRNSFQQVFKSSVTKAWRYGYKMSLKTAGKGFIYLGLSSFNVGWLLDSILGGVVG